MSVLVTGGTGLVGSHVVRELLARDVEVGVLTRDAARAAQLPARASAVVGNLLDPATVRSVFRGFDAVFLLNPVGASEAQEGLLAVAGMRSAGVRGVVYLSVQDAARAAYLPHFGSKVAVAAGLASSGLPYTVLAPNNFHQNDLFLKDVMLQHGVYPQPLGSAGVSRVDVRDIAEAAAIALTGHRHAGETLVLAGPDPLTGPEVAEIWSEALGREVRYGGDDMDAWEAQAVRSFPEVVAYDFRLMFERFQAEGLRATGEEVERLTAWLGHSPRSFADFARETAAAWGERPRGSR